MRTRKLRVGFTLIEMLVVLTIIVILLAIIVPVIGKTRDRAKAARCIGNLKELHAAAMNYAFRADDAYLAVRNLPFSKSSDAWDELREWRVLKIGWVHYYDLPQPAGPNMLNGRGTSPWWGSLGYKSISTVRNDINGAPWKGGVHGDTLWEYTGRNLKIYACPSFLNQNVAGVTSPNYNGTVSLTYEQLPAKGVQRSYVMNSQCSDKPVGSGNVGSRMVLFADMAEKPTPSTPGGVQVAMYGLTDARVDSAYMLGSNWDGELDGDWQTVNVRSRESIGTFHSGKGNVIFVDGHVETLLWSDTYRVWKGM